MQTTQGRLSAHAQPANVVAAGRRRRPRSPAHARGRPSQTAIRSRINTAVPCNHGGRPRMVPAPGGTTTALCIGCGVPRRCMPPGCRGRWLGVRAQAPFAVAATSARTDAVDGATPANRKRCPASVGRRTCPRPPAPAPRLHAASCEPRQLPAHRLSSQAACRTLTLGVCFLVANFVKRAAPGDSKSSVRARSACRRHGGRAAAVPPFSGPRSRGTVFSSQASRHQHRCALQAWGATANRACARGHHHHPVHLGWRATPLHAPRVPGQAAWGTGAGTIRGGRDQRKNRPC